jgi:hypothetical protein
MTWGKNINSGPPLLGALKCGYLSEREREREGGAGMREESQVLFTCRERHLKLSQDVSKAAPNDLVPKQVYMFPKP